MIPSITPDPPGAMGEAGGAVGHVARPAGSMLGYHVDRPGDHRSSEILELATPSHP